MKFYLFLILVLICFFPLIAEEGQISEFSLAANTHQIAATIHLQGSGVGEKAVLNFRSFPEGKLLTSMESDGFEAPMLFQQEGESFIHVSTIPTGSGAFVIDTIFWIAPDGTMHEIEFENAAEAFENKVDIQETVLTGGPGVDCAGNRLKFEFYIAHKADPHYCPTAGRVTGSYKIVGEKAFDSNTNSYSSTFKMLADHYSRAPVSLSEMSASSR